MSAPHPPPGFSDLRPLMGSAGLSWRARRGDQECVLRFADPEVPLDLDQAWTELAGLAQLEPHPGLAQLVDHGEFEGRLWLAREWVEGQPLSEFAENGISDRDLGAIVVRLCSALEALHGAGWVHADLKASNILVRPERKGPGEPVLTDLGLSRLAGSARSSAGGSFFSMSPEAILGSTLDGRADVFALGAMLAALLAPRSDVDASLFYARFPHQDSFFGAADIAPVDLPEWARDLTERCVARAPGDRPQSALQVGAEIARRLGLQVPDAPVGAFSLKLGPKSGREAWFAEFVREAKALSVSEAGAARCIVVETSEPLEALERELRLDVALAGVSTHVLDFTPRSLAGVAALAEWIERALPKERGVVFVADRLGGAAEAESSWRDQVLCELARAAKERAGLLLVRFARPSGTGKSEWTGEVVPQLGEGALRAILSEHLENGAESAGVAALAMRIAEDAQGSWVKVNRALSVAVQRGWLAPGERALRLFEARYEEALLAPPSAKLPLLSLGARRRLAELKAREGRPQIRRSNSLSAAVPLESSELESEGNAETELVRHGLVIRNAGQPVLTDLGDACAFQTAEGFGAAELEQVFAREADLRESQNEELGEIMLLRLRARSPGAATTLSEHAALTRERGAPARALDWMQRALAGAALSEEDRVQLLGEWCMTQAALGRPERALEACHELEHKGAVRAAARTRARVHTLRRDFDAARIEWAKVSEDPEARPHELDEAFLGEVRRLAEKGRLAELEQVVAAMRNGEHNSLDARQVLNARNLLATVRVRSDASPAAFEELRTLIEDSRREGDRGLEASIAQNLGTALRRRGGQAELAEARDLFSSAAEIHSSDGHLPGLAQARAALGGTQRELGLVRDAEASLRSALDLRERLGDARGAAGVRGMLGLALAEGGELSAAGTELERAAEELRLEHKLSGAARLFEARAELVRARLARRERAHFDAAEFDVTHDDPRIALCLGRAAALRSRLPEAVEAWHAALHAAKRKGWGAAAAEAQFLLHTFEAGDAPTELEWKGAVPLILADHLLWCELTLKRAAAGDPEEALLRLARELEASGRRDRAARAWFALARRATHVERAEHAQAAAEREFRACARGLTENEAIRLKKSLLSIPDPFPSDLEEPPMAATGRREEELQALLDIQSRLVEQQDLPSLLGKIVECALEIAGGERGFLLLEEEGELVFDTALDSRRGEEIAAPEVEVSRSVIRRALEVGRPQRLSNATQDPLLGGAASVTALELRSILCTPFDVQPQLRGVIYLDHRLRTGAFGERAEELLVHLSGQAALAIRQVRRVGEIRRLNEKLSRRVIDAEADLQSARRALEDAGLQSVRLSGLVGRSEVMRGVRALLERAAPSRLPVLIQGASGTGKELAARALHEQSGARRAGPFVSESCAALPESLIESELFGYRRGAFTGAEEDRPGIFERADGGTLFLDEIGELPLDLQSKLLRVLETGRVRRLGDAEELRVDFRLVAATNRDLEVEVAEERFRADLRYRLDALRVQMPPLANRLEDIPLLVDHFLKREGEMAEGERTRRVSDSVMAALCRRLWPGNVRELSNEVARLCVLSEGDLVDEELVRVPAPTAVGGPPHGGVEPLESVERRAILAAIEACSDDKRRAAKELGISRAKIYQKLKAWRARGLID